MDQGRGRYRESGMRELTARLARCYTGAVHHALRTIGDGNIVERWSRDGFGEPITIGTVIIATGDSLLGDRDGVVVIPQAIVEEVVTRTETVVATESDMRRALLDGMDPVEAYHRFGKF